MSEESSYIGNDGKIYTYTTDKNVKIIDKFITREVLCDVTSIVDYLLNECPAKYPQPPLDYDMQLETPEHFSCPFCGELITSDNLTEITEEECSQLKAEYNELDTEFPYMCPICGATYIREEDAQYCCAGSQVYFCDECGEYIPEEDLETSDQPTAVAEWLMVTEWLGKKLAEKGEMVLKTEDLSFIWGRRFSDSIKFEKSIRSICYDVEILEGQKKEVKV